VVSNGHATTRPQGYRKVTESHPGLLADL